ncbi:MAG: cupredoxin domain-containing protein [Candidatus Magasanikbacteria bacterium]|nr:cupredoxin domain-containing protein [Candidatus Magasanikbacteria bacterium]
MSKKLAIILATVGALTVLGAGCNKSPLLSGKSTQPADPTISVSDQNLAENNEIIVAKASIPEDGWIAIHAKENGQIGEIIGYTALPTGTDTKIKITVDRNKVSPSLVAMLHYDRDPKGAFESPGSDGAVIKDQQVIMQEFTILNQGEITKATVPTNTTSNRKEFIVTAKQWSFSPSTIKVKKGDTVVLKVTSVDVAHGLMLPSFNIKETLEPGKTKTIEFAADKAGTFTFSCSVACGAGHKAMTGTLVVE